MTGKEKSSRGRKPLVTLEAVMDAALEIADSEGLGELTIRGVARKLGVRPMALYAHVDSVSDLEDLAFRRAVGRAGEFSAGGEDWEERFVSFWREFRAGMLSHPGAGAIFARRMVPTPETARATDWLFGMLEEAGFQGDALMVAYSAGFFYTFGAFAFELTRQADARASLVELGGAEETLANLGRYEQRLANVDRDAVFEAGLRVVVEGLRALRRG